MTRSARKLDEVCDVRSMDADCPDLHFGIEQTVLGGHARHLGQPVGLDRTPSDLEAQEALDVAG